MDHRHNQYPFRLAPYIKSATAIRLGIDNTPPGEVIPRLQALHRNIFCPIAEEFAKYDFHHPLINSGYRCLELNRALKSKDTSQHIRGEAIDIEVEGFDNKGLFEFCKTLDYDQLILEFYNIEDPQSGWVHISYAHDRINRREAFEINK